MKRSRRVVLTMMGSAAAGAVSTGWVGAPNCGRNEVLMTGADGGRPFCRVRSGFGVTSQTIYRPGPVPSMAGTSITATSIGAAAASSMLAANSLDAAHRLFRAG